MEYCGYKVGLSTAYMLHYDFKVQIQSITD